MRLPRRLAQAGWVKLRRFGGLTELPDSKRGTPGEILLALSVVEAKRADRRNCMLSAGAKLGACEILAPLGAYEPASPGLGLL